MTGPAVETQEQEQQQESTETQQQDTQQQSEQTPQTPAPTDFDYRSLYQDSTRARIAAETELARMREEARRTPVSNEPDVTDEDVAQRPAQAIRTMIQRELASALGPVNEISQSFRTNQAIESAEEMVFNAYPKLAQYRSNLGPKVRNALKGASNVDPSIYAVTLKAIIGDEAMNALDNVQQPAPTPASRPNGAPTPRPNGASPAAAPSNTPKLTEMERGAMKRAGYDPNKPADVKAFWDIVNNEEGIEV